MAVKHNLVMGLHVSCHLMLFSEGSAACNTTPRQGFVCLGQVRLKVSLNIIEIKRFVTTGFYLAKIVPTLFKVVGRAHIFIILKPETNIIISLSLATSLIKII